MSFTPAFGVDDDFLHDNKTGDILLKQDETSCILFPMFIFLDLESKLELEC